MIAFGPGKLALATFWTYDIWARLGLVWLVRQTCQMRSIMPRLLLLPPCKLDYAAAQVFWRHLGPTASSRMLSRHHEAICGQNRLCRVITLSHELQAHHLTVTVTRSHACSLGSLHLPRFDTCGPPSKPSASRMTLFWWCVNMLPVVKRCRKLSSLLPLRLQILQCTCIRHVVWAMLLQLLQVS